MTLKSSPPNLAHLFISSFCLRKQTFHHCWPLIIHPKSAKEPRQTNGVCRSRCGGANFANSTVLEIFSKVSPQIMSERFRANLRPLNIRIIIMKWANSVCFRQDAQRIFYGFFWVSSVKVGRSLFIYKPNFDSHIKGREKFVNGS